MAETRSLGATKTRIAGVGSYVPARVLSNHDLEQMVDTSDAWIRERTGIAERRIAAEGECSSDMALAAAKQALEMAGLQATDLDMIIVATVTGDHPWPACAALLQHKLGAGEIPAFDVSAACAGFLYAMSIGDQFISTAKYKNILIVGVELLSRIVNWKDRGTCILFGDGAGAAVLSQSDGDEGIVGTLLHTDGSLAGSLMQPAGGSALPMTPELIAEGQDKVRMNGQDIFKAAVRNLTSASTQIVEQAGLTPNDIDWVVPHQANMRIITQIAARVKIPLERFVLNLERYGNTSSASIPIALAEGLADGRIKRGDRVLMCALGGGVSWASALVTI